MLNRTEFIQRFSSGVHLLDGATGTELRKAGMPKNCCAEQWILEHPQSVLSLQKRYADVGSEIIYAPTFLAQPLALQKWNLSAEAEKMNRDLIALSRSAAPDCLVAGNMTTMQGCVDPRRADTEAQMENAYRVQMEALVSGSPDILVAETLMSFTEAMIILDLAYQLNAPALMISFTCTDDGRLYSGELLPDVIGSLEAHGAAAVGVNCIAASDRLPLLIGALSSRTTLPVICKPNAGIPVDGKYPVGSSLFSSIMRDCAGSGARLIGGCCGTTPDYIEALKTVVKA